MARRYVLISPCRDEADYCRRTLDSVVAQTVRPSLWLIVDDGSSDATPAILAEYAERYEFIEVHSRQDRGARSVGPGVIDAFYAGFERIDPSEFGYLCKLDLDLELPETYFETLMQHMEQDPRLGTVSGKPFFEAAGELVSEAIGDEMSAGMTKFYRRQCFAEIGGFVREVMWDGIDCHRCRMLGWKAASLDSEALRFLHLRAMGSSHKGILEGRRRHGRGQYFMGTGLAYMTASSLFRMTRPPRIVGGLAMLHGYLQSMFRRAPRYEDAQFRKFLRRCQRQFLWKGKRRAVHALDTEIDARTPRGGEGT